MLAFTLSRKDFREHDQQISFYTGEFGKMVTVARGVKKIISKNAAAFEPFALLDIEIAKGRGLTYVTRAQSVESFRSLRLDLRKTLLGSYGITLVNKFTEEGERDEKLFNLLHNFFKELNDAAVADNLVAYDFLRKFLSALGFAPLGKIADSSLIKYGEFHLNRQVPDIANFMRKLYNFQK